MRKLLFIAFLVISQMGWSQEKAYQTLTYFQNDTLSLDLDLFLPSTAEDQQSTPLVIFVHGGGFQGGDRSRRHGFCQHLAENGIAAATITYTLYMRESQQSFGCDGKVTEKIKAIQIAANQLWQATGFFLEDPSLYNIDPSKIFIAGSSAGGETAYGAAYWEPQVMGIYPRILPRDFKYAGMIAGAGAIVDINLITKESMIPSMLFHGTCDDLVPYNIGAHHYCQSNSSGWLMLFGDYAVHERLCELNGISHMVTYCGGNHSYAGKPFEQEREKILGFIRNVTASNHFQYHEVISIDNECEELADYDFCR